MEWLNNNSLSFYDTESIFENTIRHNSDKHNIVSYYADMKNLTHVNLRKCRLNFLPEFKSKCIEFLDLSCNNLTSIPDWVFKLENLKYLNVGSNLLTHLPDTCHMSLETLKVHKNKLSKLKTCKTLRFLNLYLNNFEYIPDVSYCEKLEFLSYGMTNISKLPCWITSFVHLKWLSLVVNKIETLPNNFHLLSRLKGVRLAKNNLSSLPDEIGALSDLEELTLYANNLNTLPESFFDLKLKKLNLSKNKIEIKDKLKEKFAGIEFFSID